MGTYQVPRNVKGEGRIFFIFSTKALIYTAIGLALGLIFVMAFGIINLSFVGYILMGIFALLGYVIATLKMPNTTKFEITKKTGGEKIDDVLKRAIKYKTKGGNIYIYKKIENSKNDIKTNEKN